MLFPRLQNELKQNEIKKYTVAKRCFHSHPLSTSFTFLNVRHHLLFGHLPVDCFARLETRHATPGLIDFVEELVVRRVASFFHQNQQNTRRHFIADARQSAYRSALKASVQ